MRRLRIEVESARGRYAEAEEGEGAPGSRIPPHSVDPRSDDKIGQPDEVGQPEQAQHICARERYEFYHTIEARRPIRQAGEDRHLLTRCEVRNHRIILGGCGDGLPGDAHDKLTEAETGRLGRTSLRRRSRSQRGLVPP